MPNIEDDWLLTPTPWKMSEKMKIWAWTIRCLKTLVRLLDSEWKTCSTSCMIDLEIRKHCFTFANRSPKITKITDLRTLTDSTWGRYFRNAELERIIQNDLARLYPEHENFFQSSTCQAMLRRILLVWALIHPQYGYRQGDALKSHLITTLFLVKLIWYLVMDILFLLV